MTTEEKNRLTLKISELAEKAKSGNRWSFQELMGMFQEDIYRLVYYRTYSKMDAEDITQEVFVQAYNKLDSLKDSERFRAWLYTIAVNRCNDFLRKRKYLSMLQFKSAQNQELMEEKRDMNNNFNESLAREKFWQQVKSLLGKLSSMEREVFTLRFMDHQDINEIATILDKSESTVKTHLYRALDKLRKDAALFQEYRGSLA
jgi:RNA polymerase sigma-70 factor (ECF subfamily)